MQDEPYLPNPAAGPKSVESEGLGNLDTGIKKDNTPVETKVKEVASAIGVGDQAEVPLLHQVDHHCDTLMSLRIKIIENRLNASWASLACGRMTISEKGKGCCTPRGREYDNVSMTVFSSRYFANKFLDLYNLCKPTNSW